MVLSLAPKPPSESLPLPMFECPPTRGKPNPLEAGSIYGFVQTSLLEEGKEPEEQLVGLQKLERWIARCEQGQTFERLYSNPELAEDPHYRAELERQIEALVPDPEEREALHSLYAFRYSSEK